MSAAGGRRRGEVFDEDKWVKAMDGRKFVSSSSGYIRSEKTSLEISPSRTSARVPGLRRVWMVWSKSERNNAGRRCWESTVSTWLLLSDVADVYAALRIEQNRVLTSRYSSHSLRPSYSRPWKVLVHPALGRCWGLG